MAEAPSPNPQTGWKDGLVAMAIGGALTGGFFLVMTGNAAAALGTVLFIALPITVGFVVAVVARSLKVASIVLLSILVFVAALLLLLGKEGWVCILMAAPLLIAGLAIGALTGRSYEARVLDGSKRPATGRNTILVLAPLLLLSADRIERPFRMVAREDTFSTSLRVNASPEDVWEKIQRVDSINAPKPLLLRIGLPVPQRCVLQAERAGSKRICYFNTGYIEERITEWNPPRVMGLEITAVTLPGRHWLGFKNARYEIREEGSETVIIRQTTITARLYPAFYWRPLEALGVQAEHQYLLQSLAQELQQTPRYLSYRVMPSGAARGFSSRRQVRCFPRCIGVGMTSSGARKSLTAYWQSGMMIGIF